MREIITRFAPSPTGYLHIGGLRTALFNYLFARSNGGKFLLRIEDTDLARNSIEATEAIIKAFEWVGMDYDGEVLYQSKRFDLYKNYIHKLISEDKAYYCYMSKEELDNLREAQKARGETPKYDNRYRDFKGTPPKDIKPVVRIKAPLEGYIEFNDGVKGSIKVEVKELDDFIIARSDGSPTYNFVVTIDDALSKVSDIIRGDDHLSNTPKQIIVYKALGFDIPNFYHVPMILNPQGQKLSKRDGAMGVMDYKKEGYLPEAILNFLVRLGWSHKDQEIFSMEEMLKLFNPKDLNSSPSSYNQEKFLWLNTHYIKEKSNDALENLLEEFQCPKIQKSQRNVLYTALKDRVSTLKDFAANAIDILTPPCSYDEKSLSKINEQSYETLKKFLSMLEKSFLDTPEKCNECLHKFMDQESLKPGNFMQPLRIALLGKPGGIGIAETIYVIGKEDTIKRIEKFCKA
ncbi:glutamate--tRNA ligase [Helicobacter cappadocius]|uniref:Glutamate--tRNA ligase n=1 Tax=Helicobacter cappadocius TaxID=3063998 RepID=A0AA90SS48_9HELI|nr:MULTISPECIES: glutamate--tRNA ligase [unclassified Helicobacter]MDO7252667.1 glutamate--tRNA ligase [Helicobacter sp. faydin-H75]MDP2538534.1 glutamate--tRNA ligase [Helicobacter sp. faydin-H76]